MMIQENEENLEINFFCERMLASWVRLRSIMVNKLLRTATFAVLIILSWQAGSSTNNNNSCAVPSTTQIGASVLLVGVVGTYSLLAVKETISRSVGCLVSED